MFEPVPERAQVALFPLPNVVLFPGAVLPLHIFEPRYRRMTADALAGDSRIAMALLCAGWEKNYYSRPRIEPVVCIGQIVAHEKLADGNYNLLVQGRLRARVDDEFVVEGPTPYRIGELEPLIETETMEIDLSSERQRLMELFSDRPPEDVLGVQIARLLAGPVATAQVADLIAFNFLDDAAVKQSLLAETDVQRRVARLVEAMQSHSAVLATKPVAARGEQCGLN